LHLQYRLRYYLFPVPILALLFSIAPFVFGVIRAFSAHDYRMITMAVFGFIAALILRPFVLTRPGSGGTLLVFVVTTVVAAIVAYLMGATAAAGIWPVAIVFGFCNATSHFLTVRSRQPSST
jgi:hypothetical protein